MEREPQPLTLNIYSLREASRHPRDDACTALPWTSPYSTALQALGLCQC